MKKALDYPFRREVYELINGRLKGKPAPEFEHQVVLRDMGFLIRGALRRGGTIVVQPDFISDVKEYWMVCYNSIAVERVRWN